MKFLGLFLVWATLAFVAAWVVATPWQRVIAAVAGGVAAPGSQIEWMDLELFYPFDVSVLIALCLASTWASWGARARALAVGVPVLIVVEILSLAIAMRILIATTGEDPARTDAVQRLALGVIRITGLVAAAAIWTFVLGRERLGLVSRALGSPATHRRRST